MQQSAFIAHSPYEVGDKINIIFAKGINIVSGIFSRGIGIVNGPVTERTEEVTITDILAVHSCKRQQVNFMYEINNDKVMQLIEWEAVKLGK